MCLRPKENEILPFIHSKPAKDKRIFNNIDIQINNRLDRSTLINDKMSKKMLQKSEKVQEQSIREIQYQNELMIKQLEAEVAELINSSAINPVKTKAAHQEQLDEEMTNNIRSNKVGNDHSIDLYESNRPNHDFGIR